MGEHTFYSICTTDTLEPVREWTAKVGGHDSRGCWYEIKSDKTVIRLYSPYKRAYYWEYYDDAETAENARRMAILGQLREVRANRASLYSREKALKQEINSWKGN